MFDPISHAFLMKTYLYETSGYFTLTLDTILGAGQQVLPEKRSIDGLVIRLSFTV